MAFRTDITGNVVKDNTPKGTKLIWRDHDSNGHAKRVWRDDWSGDQFEVVPPKSFEMLKAAVNDVNQLMRSTIIELVEAEDN